MRIQVTKPRVYTLEVPLKAATSSKKVMRLNLNIYRNTHYQSLNKAKRAFKRAVAKQLSKIPKLGCVDIHYTIFPPTKAKIDIMNVGSIVDKFLCDAMVEVGILTDDNYQIVQNVSFSFGEVSPQNERAKVCITETKLRKEIPMRIFLEKQEVHSALSAFVNETLGLEAEELVFSMDGNELSVEVITNASPAAKPKSKRRVGTPRKTAAKATLNTEETPDADQTDAEGTVDKSGAGSPESDGDEKPAAVKGGSEKEATTETPKSDKDGETEGNLGANKPPKKSSSIFGD